MEELTPTTVRKKLEEMGVVGALVHLNRPTQDWTLQYGTRIIGGDRSIQVNDRFRIGSITKTFTGLGILILVDKGLIDLDLPVNNYLDGIPRGDIITVRDIGSMRSGIVEYGQTLEFENTYLNEPYRERPSRELLALGITQPPIFSPGTQFSYSNTNTIILGLIIERSTGKSLSQFFQEEIFDPLELRDTELELDCKLSSPYVRGYRYSNNKYQDTTHWTPTTGWAAGAISSTLSDLKKYVIALGTGSLITSKTFREQTTWLSTLTSSQSLTIQYGFQLMNVNSYLGHTGDLNGYTSTILYNPKNKTTIITLVSGSPSPNTQQPAIELAGWMVKEIA